MQVFKLRSQKLSWLAGGKKRLPVAGFLTTGAAQLGCERGLAKRGSRYEQTTGAELTRRKAELYEATQVCSLIIVDQAEC